MKSQVRLRQEALKLKTEKNMPVTLINQIVYGIPEVAELRLDRDIKETIYQANLEAINVTKLKLRILKLYMAYSIVIYSLICSYFFSPIPLTFIISSIALKFPFFSL